MTELWLAVRDQIGLHSSVDYNGEKVLIKDLPRGLYDIYQNQTKIFDALGPQIIPGKLLEYCAKLEREGRKFKGRPFEAVNSLELSVELANK